MTTHAIKACPLVHAAAALLVAAGLIGPTATAANTTIAFLEQRVAADPLDSVAQARLAFEYINAMRASGNLDYLPRAQAAAKASLHSVPAARNPEAVTALAVALYESHRFKEALQLAQQAVGIDPRSQIAALLIGDAQFELGDYPAAAHSYNTLTTAKTRDLVNMRLARLAAVRGETDAAIAQLAMLVDAGDDTLRARVRLQLAELHFARGDFGQARVQLEAAQRLQPGSYVIEEHLAELLAAEGRFTEAQQLYRKVLQRVARPELMHALGDLYRLCEQPAAAREWHERAKASYLRSAQGGNAHYYHHLASFFSDSDPQPKQALHWARKDLEVRHTAPAYEGLAWALYKNGQYQQAAATMDRALGFDVRSAHLLFHASAIFMNAGRIAQSQKLLQQAMTINPRYNTFHVHR